MCVYVCVCVRVCIHQTAPPSLIAMCRAHVLGVSFLGPQVYESHHAATGDQIHPKYLDQSPAGWCVSWCVSRTRL